MAEREPPEEDVVGQETWAVQLAHYRHRRPDFVIVPDWGSYAGRADTIAPAGRNHGHNERVTAIAAILATVILGVLAVFQVALAAGAPIGRFAWGGQHDVLPSLLAAMPNCP